MKMIHLSRRELAVVSLELEAADLSRGGKARVTYFHDSEMSRAFHQGCLGSWKELEIL